MNPTGRRQKKRMIDRKIYACSAQSFSTTFFFFVIFAGFSVTGHKTGDKVEHVTRHMSGQDTGHVTEKMSGHITGLETGQVTRQLKGQVT